MGSRSGFDSQLDFTELQNVIDIGSGAVSVAQRQANALFNLGLLPAATPGTPGIVVANGNLVAGANSNLNTLEIDALSSGRSGTAGLFTLFPATAAKGSTTLTMSNNTGNTVTNINVAAQGGARTYTVPDAGASGNFVISSGVTITGGGSTLALTSANGGQTILLNTAGGSVVTLPAATGSGIKYKFVVSVLATSNSHILYTSSANAVGGTANNFIGVIVGSRIDSGNAVLGFAAQATSNTITLNRTTTGSVSLGEEFNVQDVAANVWQIDGFLTATGAAFATPFSHT